MKQGGFFGTVRCAVHGESTVYVVCQHIFRNKERGLGFSAISPRPEDPIGYAWCDRCQAMLDREGGWNKRAERFTNPQVVCSGCFESRFRRDSRK
jgi:hypothetical protein